MDRTEQEENKEKDIFRYLINKGIPYSASTLDEAETFTSKLQSAEKENYFDLEERFSAVLAKYEEEAYSFGFKEGIRFILDCLYINP